MRKVSIIQKVASYVIILMDVSVDISQFESDKQFTACNATRVPPSLVFC